jgi:hypothetical protein
MRPPRYLRASTAMIDDPLSVDEELGNLQGFEEYNARRVGQGRLPLVEIAGRLTERFDESVVEGPRPGSGRTRAAQGDRRGR